MDELKAANKKATSVRMRDIALRAGVSVSSVSRVLNGRPGVAPATREAVRKAAEELGYSPSPRGERGPGRETIALLLPDVGNPFFTEVFKGVLEAARRFGCDVMVEDSNEQIELESAFVKRLLQRPVHGLVYMTAADQPNESLNTLCETGIPVVAIDRRIPGFAGDVVETDNIRGAYLATHHLIQLGHRRIAMVAGPFYLSTVADRIRGFQTALQQFGLSVPPEWIAEEEFSWEGGYRAARTLGFDRGGPTAVVCGNDLLAIGVIRAVEDCGKKVPQDVAVIGYDGTYLASCIKPSLTTVVQPAREMGEVAVRILMERLRGKRVKPRSVLLEAQLRIGDTCGAKPQGPVLSAVGQRAELYDFAR